MRTEQAHLLLLHLPLSTGVSCQIEVGQSPPSLTRSQGEISILTCSYSGTVSYIQWYRLFPGESPVFLLKKRNEAGERFFFSLEKSKSSVSLRITALELGDAAIYFCAFSRDTHSVEINREP
uniref:Ig-like domain-containing protein n=1 Tax=Gopherus evgoodei TaxID=1825980 RepID=A0A8C4Y8G6_9SAUR